MRPINPLRHHFRVARAPKPRAEGRFYLPNGAAENLGLRVVAVERPRTHLGLSGGGPYALACGAVPPLVGGVAAVGVLGGVTPTVGPEACAIGAIDSRRRFAPLLSPLRWALSALVSGRVLPVLPLGHYAYLA